MNKHDAEQAAVVKAALDLFVATATAAFKIPVPNTTPQVFVMCGEPEQLLALLVDGGEAPAHFSEVGKRNWRIGQLLIEREAKG